MINYIIYSKDRACQLDLLLRSIDKFADGKIGCTVLCKTSNSDFVEGYKKLSKNKYRCLKSLIPEMNYRYDTLLLIKDNQSELFGFFTDDTVLYRPFEIDTDEIYQTMKDNKCYSFSLRSGLNITEQCHYRQEGYIKPEYIYNKDNLLIWDTTKHSYGTNNGRPMSIDGNFFTYEELYKTLTKYDFKCPRTLDGIDTFYIRPNMMSFKESIAVNLPVNLSADGNIPDNFSHFYHFSLESLNKQFLEGKVIDLDNLDFSNIHMSHHELEFKFI